MGRLAFLLLLLLAPMVRGAEFPHWESWDRCELVADQYFDGDSFHVRHQGVVTIVRLYFVDAPESDDGYGSLVSEQAAWFKVSQSTVVRAGDLAKAFAEKFLAGGFRVRTRLQHAPGASRSQRFYGIVEAKGRRLDAALIEAGLARVSGEVADFPDAASGQQTVLTLRQFEAQAAQARRGVWAFANGAKERLGDAVRPRSVAAQAQSRTNVNTATMAELEALPGIGPKTAEVLIRARPIKDFEALDAIPGFGPKKIEALRGLIRFE
jgi:DNA uptake protein ComE-like DNA-binding protein